MPAVKALEGCTVPKVPTSAQTDQLKTGSNPKSFNQHLDRLLWLPGTRLEKRDMPQAHGATSQNVFLHMKRSSAQGCQVPLLAMQSRGVPPVDVLTVVQRKLLQGECHSQDAAGGRPTHQVEQLPDGLASALLQLPQHANGGNALHTMGWCISWLSFGCALPQLFYCALLQLFCCALPQLFYCAVTVQTLVLKVPYRAEPSRVHMWLRNLQVGLCVASIPLY